MKKSEPDQKKAILDGLIELFGQHRRWLLFFGTGTSIALDKRLGMPALADYLVDTMPSDAEGWADVLSQLKANKTLEQALTGISLPTETKLQIQKIAGDFVASCDWDLRDDVLLGTKQWPGEILIRSLVQRLPPRNPCLSMITSNYDMLIEYSCARNGIRYTTGYVGELLRTRDWQQAQDGLMRFKSIQQRGRKVVYGDPLPHVELHKVHGSINLFRRPDGKGFVECDAWANKPPDNVRREVAAPGDQKFQTVAEAPDSSFDACKAEGSAMAFMVIGYGFNDPHLHDRILEKVRRQDCPLIVLSLSLPDSTIAKLRMCGSKTWILTAEKDSQGSLNGTRISYHQAENILLTGDEHLWSCDSFAAKILGG